jgi:hypothetical protein
MHHHRIRDLKDAILVSTVVAALLAFAGMTLPLVSA